MSPERSADGGRPVGSPAENRLRVDPISCEGIGLCAHEAPGVIELDRWGYPLVAESDLSGGDLARARRAVRACPRGALWLVDARAGGHGRPRV